MSVLLLTALIHLHAPAFSVGAEEPEDRAAAIELWTRRLADAQEDPDRASWARIACGLAGLHAGNGAYGEARNLLQDVLRWADTVEDKRQAARTLSALGIVCEGLGDYGDASTYLSRAIALSQDVGEPAWEAAALSAMGVVQLRMGEPRGALYFLDRALAKRDALGDRRGRAATQANLGIARLALGEHKAALALFQEALAVQEALKLYGDKARTLADIGGAWERIGAYRTAAQHFEEARLICEARNQRADLASILIGLGNVQVLLGDYAAAIRLHERAVDLLQALGQRQRFAAALSNLGAIHESLGGTERALALHERALAVYRDLGERAGEAAGLRRVGALYARLGRNGQALEVLENALRIARDVGDETSEVLVLGSLGNAHLAAGRLAAAKLRQEQALEKARGLGQRDLVASTLGNLGLVHFELGEYEQALALQEEALDLAREIGLRRTVLLNRWGIALARLARGDAQGAREQVRLAAEEIDAAISGLDDIAGPDAREVWAGLFEVGVLAGVALGDVEQAFGCMESGRARSLLDALGGRGTLAARTLPPEFVEAEACARRREHEAMLAHRAAVRTHNLADARRLAAQLEAAREAVASVVARTQREARAASDIVHPEPPSLEAVQARLGEHEAMVVYALIGARTFAVVITREARRLAELGSAAEVRAACQALRLDRPDGSPEPTLARLRQLVVAPLGLDPTLQRLIVSPHDALSYVPMVLLVPGVDIAYTPSAGSYVLLGAAALQRGEGVLALGDPAYGTARTSAERGRGGRLSGRPLPGLPATRDEVEAIGDRVLLGAQASVSGFFAALGERPRWRAVHFACHGVVDPERPFDSALALAPDTESDGYLTALDLLGHRIPADLTVLSGCETGRGRIYRAEGIVGLTRAFMFAGSPRVLCSLWKVDDEATRALMVRFYELWNPRPKAPGPAQGVPGRASEPLPAVRPEVAGLSAAAALRQAQAYIRSQKQWSHPYYWAAWALWGLPD